MIYLLALLSACATPDPVAPIDPCRSGPTLDVYPSPSAFEVVADQTRVGTVQVPATGPVVFLPAPEAPTVLTASFEADFATYANTTIEETWGSGSFEDGVRSHYICTRSIERTDPLYAAALQRRAGRPIDGVAYTMAPLADSP